MWAVYHQNHQKKFVTNSDNEEEEERSLELGDPGCVVPDQEGENHGPNLGPNHGLDLDPDRGFENDRGHDHGPNHGPKQDILGPNL